MGLLVGRFFPAIYVFFIFLSLSFKFFYFGWLHYGSTRFLLTVYGGGFVENNKNCIGRGHVDLVSESDRTQMDKFQVKDDSYWIWTREHGSGL